MRLINELWAASDEILLDLLAAVLLGFQPARHPAAARPGFLRLWVPVLRLDLPHPTPRRRLPVTVCQGALARTPPPFCNPITQTSKLGLQFHPLRRPGLIMLLLNP